MQLSGVPTICNGSQMGFWFHYLIMYETSSLFLITELVVLKVCNRLSVIYFTSWNREQGKKKKFGAESRYGWVCVLLLFIFEMTRHVKPASSETFQCWKRKFLIFIPGIYTDTAIVDRCLLEACQIEHEGAQDCCWQLRWPSTPKIRGCHNKQHQNTYTSFMNFLRQNNQVLFLLYFYFSRLVYTNDSDVSRI